MSRGELITHCFKSKHILIVSIYQIAILMQFNMNLLYTVGQLQSITMITLDILIQMVKHLLKVQLGFPIPDPGIPDDFRGNLNPGN